MIRLLTSLYPEPSLERSKEISQCLMNNLENPYIDSVHLYLELIEEPPFYHKNLRTRLIENRPSYDDFFHWVQESSPAANDLTIIANSDIYFDSSLNGLLTSQKINQCAALTRWDRISMGDSVFLNRNDSQDTWVFRGPLKTIYGNFQVGVPRCDNRILFELQRAGYEVINPAFSVRTYHLHEGDRGEYKNENLDHFVDPPYAYLWPHNLWSLPRTVIHNLRHPDEKVSWRFDKRKFSRSLPVRVLNKVVGHGSKVVRRKT